MAELIPFFSKLNTTNRYIIAMSWLTKSKHNVPGFFFYSKIIIFDNITVDDCTSFKTHNLAILSFMSV